MKTLPGRHPNRHCHELERRGITDVAAGGPHVELPALPLLFQITPAVPRHHHKVLCRRTTDAQ